MCQINQIYNKLLDHYGAQGWWPLLDYQKNINDDGLWGYHPDDYSLPKTKIQRFEVCIGAILTQNTAWKNVQKALINLKKLNAIKPDTLKKIDIEKLKKAITPAGYYNQKSKKLKIFADFFISVKNKIPTRNDLLSVWGIGPETADSILLYAYKKPEFVVDAYTKRMFTNLGLIDDNYNYEKIKSFFEENLKNDIIVYQEYHALIVKHAGIYYRKKTNTCKDPLLS